MLNTVGSKFFKLLNFLHTNARSNKLVSDQILFSDLIEKDTKEIYESNPGNNKNRKVYESFDRTYQNPECKITFLRKWGGDPSCDGIGYYGYANVVMRDFTLMKDICDAIRLLKYGTLLGSYSRVNDIKFTYIDDNELCLLILNSFLHDESSVLCSFPKDIISCIVNQIFDLNECIGNEIRGIGGF